MKNSTLSITLTAIISALYCALTVALYPLSYGPIQFRVSEALCILPLFIPQAIVGLSIGCFLSNIFSTAGPLDMLFGTIATLLACIVSFIAGKHLKNTFLKLFIAVISPTIFNAFIVPFAILSVTEITQIYFVTALWVGLGELGVMTILGIPLYFALKPVAKKLFLIFTKTEK